MHKINMFDRTGVLTTVGFENSGADWLNNIKKYIGEENVIVTSQNICPESNDLALQLRKHGFNNVILAGMSANLCTESHMRDLVELVLGSQ
jgi:nicotinamidase-related amidase